MASSLEIYVFSGCDTPVCKTAYTMVLSQVKQLAAILGKSVEELRGREVNIIISNTKEIKALNLQFRDVNQVTDVLAFPMGDSSLGEIWICPPVIRRNAKMFDVPYKQEIARIVIHGILHLAGHDHSGSFTEKEGKDEPMFQLQEKILKELSSE